jgi:hypothetical protein
MDAQDRDSTGPRLKQEGTFSPEPKEHGNIAEQGASSDHILEPKVRNQISTKVSNYNVERICYKRRSHLVSQLIFQA